ncbi:hypothetical protein C7M84_018585 [Penaeus vannamei]|uniref:C2H2-type domain-containing protein n=1 Tax=Penaeus vannamei TaxID=6689 RepID=A0A423SH27_PENVA|nr:hypothetical protein C7M84_018585 [Penaeus vannamei]
MADGDLKPFVCGWCPYRALRRGDMKKHLRTHTGEKPYACPACAFRSADSRGAAKGGPQPYDARFPRDPWGSSGPRGLLRHEGGAVLVVGSAPLRARRAPPGFAASAHRTRVLLYEALRNPTRGLCRSFGAQVSVAQSCCLGGRRPSCCQGRRKSFQGPGAAGAARPRPRLASAEQERASQERAWFLAQMITGIGRHESGLETGARRLTDKRGRRTLSSASSLERHLRYHRGERRHACPHCPYRAVARDKLVRHLHTHTGHRPHRCRLCPFAAIQATDLRKHERSKHAAHGGPLP